MAKANGFILVWESQLHSPGRFVVEGFTLKYRHWFTDLTLTPTGRNITNFQLPPAQPRLFWRQCTSTKGSGRAFFGGVIFTAFFFLGVDIFFRSSKHQHLRAISGAL